MLDAGKRPPDILGRVARSMSGAGWRNEAVDADCLGCARHTDLGTHVESRLAENQERSESSAIQVVAADTRRDRRTRRSVVRRGVRHIERQRLEVQATGTREHQHLPQRQPAVGFDGQLAFAQLALVC
jgi:hypothetical protein